MHSPNLSDQANFAGILINALVSAANKHLSQLPQEFLLEISFAERATLISWLSRLTDNKEFQQGGVKSIVLARKSFDYLKKACEDKSSRESFLTFLTAFAGMEQELNQWVLEGGTTENRAEARTRILAAYDSNSSRLSLKNLGLKTLPNCIGNLTALTNLILNDNQLEALPESLRNLSALNFLDFSGNPLKNKLKSILIPLNILAVAANKTPSPFLFLCEISSAERATLSSWLSRLSYVKEFQQGGGKEKALAEKIFDYLERADKDKSFRETFFTVLAGAAETCGDRMALSLLHVGIAHDLKALDLKNPKKVAEFLKRGVWAMNLLEKIARKKVEKLPGVDEIEVYLAYPIKLKETLKLPINIEGMLYFGYSKVKEWDLNVAANSVLEHFENEEAYYTFLVKHDKWIETLKMHDPKEYERINSNRYEDMEKGNYTPEASKLAQVFYEKELVALSKEILSEQQTTMTTTTTTMKKV